MAAVGTYAFVEAARMPLRPGELAKWSPRSLKIIGSGAL